MREPRGIDSRAAEQFLEARFETPRKNGTKRGGEFANFFRLLADARQTRAQIFDQMAAFGTAHIIQLVERFEQAGVQRLAEAFLIVFGFRHGGREAGDDSGQAQDRDDVHIRGGSGYLAEFFRDAHVGLRQFAIHLHRSSGGGIDVDVNFDVAAMNALSQNLPQAQFVKIEAFRKAQLQIRESGG